MMVIPQPDLGTKWAPTYVRVVEAMPLTGTNKVDKQPLRRDAWMCADGVYWRAGPDGPYRRMSAEDVEAMAGRFAANGRSQLLALPARG